MTVADGLAPSVPTESFSSDDADRQGVLRVSGDLDTQHAAEFRSTLRSVARLPLLILDLSDVGYIDSVGLGVLIGGIRDVDEHGGRTLVVARPGPILDLLERVGVASLAPVFLTLSEANTHLTQEAIAPVVEPEGEKRIRRGQRRRHP